MPYPHCFTRDVSTIDGRILSSYSFDINPAPTLIANETLYNEISHACEEHRVTSLDNSLAARKDDQA
jgi:hypothetical protein